MKRKLLNTRFLKQTALAVPAAALMLGAAQAGTTVGLNFQAWYYDSGTTPQTVGFGDGYQTTGFPVTAKAFGVAVGNWFNTDPLDCRSAISTSVAFGGTLNAQVTAPNAWQSGIGELVAGWNPETVTPGDNEVTWGYLDDGNTTGQSPQVTVSGLAAKFPSGYVVTTIVGGSGATSFNDVDFTDLVSTNTASYATHYVANPESDGYVSGGTVGLSAPSGTFTSDTIYVNPQPKTAGHRSTLAGFIITDQPVITLDPVGSSALQGAAVTLSATVVAVTNGLYFQWRQDGADVPGANSATYTLSNAPLGSFNYDLVVTNLYGAATSAVATVTVAMPATLTWDANTGTTGAQDGSGNWDNGVTANWWNGTGDVVWGSLDNAVFGAGGTGAYTVTVTNNVTANSLTFDSGNYTIAGSATLTLAASSQIVANTNATISLALAGTSGLTKNGNGTLAFSVGQAYTGGTTINGGVVDLTGGGGASGTIAGAVTVNTNGTLQIDTGDGFGYNADATVINPLNIVGGTVRYKCQRQSNAGRCRHQHDGRHLSPASPTAT